MLGLGQAGLPVALAFARRFPTVGYDVDGRRVARLREGRDDNGEVPGELLRQSRLRLSHDAGAIEGASLLVVVVPTGLDAGRRPELSALDAATETVGARLGPGAVVVYESTVPPGTTERRCRPRLEAASALRCGRDFGLAYCPERINPGERGRPVERIARVVGASDAASLQRVVAAYRAILQAEVHGAPSIGVAEMAKVLENAQRDLNVALMNEAAMICDALGIATREVLDAAASKWNFLPFRPGLVGGPCLPAASQLLVHAAEQRGYEPRLLPAGRQVNERVAGHVARRTVELLAAAGVRPARARVALCGLAYKPDVRRAHHSGALDLLRALRAAEIDPVVHDPVLDAHTVRTEHGLHLTGWSEIGELDALLLAVAHGHYRRLPSRELLAPLRRGGVLVDLPALFDRSALPAHLRYWSL